MKKLLAVLVSLALTSGFGIVPAAFADADRNITIDFEEFAEGAIYTSKAYGAGVLNVNTNVAGNTATIVTDGEMGSKALKLTKGVDKGELRFWYQFNENMNSGKYDIYADVRVPHAEADIGKFAALTGNTNFGQTVSGMQLYGDGAMINGSQYYGGICDGKKLTLHYIIDGDNKTISLEIIKNNQVEKRYDGLANVSNFTNIGINNISFLIRDPETAGNGNWFYTWDYDKSTKVVKEPTVVYIDNIIIKKAELSVESCEYSSLTESVTVTLNTEADDNYVNHDYIKIYDDSFRLLEDCSYSKTGNIINIKNETGFSEGKYTVMIDSLAAKDTSYSSLSQTYITVVTVRGENILEYIDFENFNENEEFFSTSYNMGKLNFLKNINTNSAVVVTDEEIGSKALKLTKGVEKGELRFWYQFNENIKSGKYDIYADVRVPHAEADIGKFAALTGNINFGQTVSGMQLYGEGAMINGSQYYRGICDGKKLTLHYIIDGDNKTVSMEIIKNNQVEKRYDGLANISNFTNIGINNMGFLIRDPETAGSGNWFYTWDYDKSTKVVKEPTVIYIDNIILKQQAIEAVSASRNGNRFTVSFTEEPADDFASSFEIISNCNPVEFTAEKNGNEVILTLKNGISYGDLYTINLKKGLNAKDSGIYKTVENYKWHFLVRAENVIISENFDDTDSLPNGFYAVTDQGTVNIVADNGNKAVKITGGQTDSNDGFKVDFQPIKSGKIRVKYDLRYENNNSLLRNVAIKGTRINGIQDKSAVNFLQYKDALYLFNTSPELLLEQYIGNIKHRFEFVIDMDRQNFDTYVDGKLVTENIGFECGNSDYSEINSLNFYITKNIMGISQNFLPDGQGDSILYVDNIEVATYTYPELITSSIKNKADDVSVSNSITFTYDKVLNADTVNTNTVRILNNETQIDGYNVSCDNDTITVSFDKPLEYDSEYTLVLGDEIASLQDERSVSKYTYVFRTMQNPDYLINILAVDADNIPADDITAFAGKDMYIKADIARRLNGYWFITALKDGTGALVDVSMVKSDDVKDCKAETVLSIPEDADGSYIIEGFLFNAITQGPICDKQFILKK